MYNLKNQTEVSKILTKCNISSNIILKKDWYYLIYKEVNMFEYKTGNILQEQTDAIINTVNRVGIMGRGKAL